MTLRFTIDMFSGRRNFSFDLRPDLAAAVVTELSLRTTERADAEAEAAAPPAPMLGYRGVVVEQKGTVGTRLPRAFRLRGGQMMAPGTPPRSVGPDLEEALLDAVELPEHRQAARMFMAMDSTQTTARPSADESVEVAPRRARAGCQRAPRFEPHTWNDGDRQQFSNNCYNYSTNYRTDTFAQPGAAAHRLFTTLRTSSVGAAAIADGLVVPVNQANDCPEEGHLVALFVAPGFDFHWYRKGRDGYWTHKIGPNEATPFDNSGERITDPRTADRGPYTEFGGFLLARHGLFRII